MTSKERKDFLIELKKEINKSTEFICNYPTDEDIVKKELNFIWVEKKGSMIGDDECHYEVIFNTSKNGNPDVASVEVHFEGDNFEDFQGIELPKELMYAEWEGRKDSRSGNKFPPPSRRCIVNSWHSKETPLLLRK